MKVEVVVPWYRDQSAADMRKRLYQRPCSTKLRSGSEAGEVPGAYRPIHVLSPREFSELGHFLVRLLEVFSAPELKVDPPHRAFVGELP